MHTLARAEYLISQCGVERELPRAGSWLENPYVFDDAARELKSMANQGLVEILVEHTVGQGSDRRIDRLTFKRLR